MRTRRTASSPEARERAVQLVLDHQGEHGSPRAAIRSIAAKIACSGETLRNRVRGAERDQGRRAGLTTDERERIQGLERESRELRQANEIPGMASAYSAMAPLAEAVARHFAQPGREPWQRETNQMAIENPGAVHAAV